MPFGAMRHGFTFQSAGAAPPGGGDTSFSLTNLTYNARQYQIPKISYAGDDSSGQPVFFVGTRNAAGDFVASLIKVNNNGTISESSVTTLKNTDERFEAQGVAGFDTSGNPVGVTVVTYRVAGVIKCDTYANQIDLDALTLDTTYSSINWTSTQPNAGFAYCTYVGNGRFLTGYRNSGIRVELQVVGTSSITTGTEKQHSQVGDGVYQGVEGFPYQNDTDYRYAFYNGNGNQQGVSWWATSTNQGDDYDDVITVGLTKTQAFALSNNSYITIASQNSSAKATGATVSWPGSGVPTQTVSSEYTMNDSASWVGGFAGGVNLTTSTLYMLYNHSVDSWKIVPMTLSGTAISEGTEIAVDADTTGWSLTGDGSCATFAESAQGNLFVALIDDTGSSNPKLYVKEIV